MLALAHCVMEEKFARLTDQANAGVVASNAQFLERLGSQIHALTGSRPRWEKQDTDGSWKFFMP